MIRYYYKVLNLIGISNPQKRVHFLVPDRSEEFPPHISIASKLLYSKNTLNRIKEIVNGRYCTITSGAPSKDDIKLALNLGFPLMNGDPTLSLNLMNQSEYKKYFSDVVGLPVAPYTCNIFKQEEIVTRLA